MKDNLKKSGLIGVLVIVLLIILFVSFFEKGAVASESFVTREFSKTRVAPGEQVTVKLKVSVSKDDTFYAIEEHIPEGWVVIDDGDGATSEPNKLSWVEFSMGIIPGKTYTYVVQAEEGSSNFYGIYMFETFKESRTTSGDTTIIVGD